MSSMFDDLEYVMIDEERLMKRVVELAKQLENDFREKDPLMICVLKGSTMFFADLARNMDIPLRFDFMAVSSYGAGTTSGRLKMKKDLDSSVEGRHVIIVEDIMDSGNTLFYLKGLLSERNAASVSICTLLDKPSRREADIKPDYTGFEIENEFVVGYGLDYNERYRNMKIVGVLKRSIYGG